MKKAAGISGAIGVVAGVLLTVLFATYAVNDNNRYMMGAIGMSGNGTMSGNIDRNFIEQMIPHHEDAIVMAQLASQKAEHEQIKTLAANIITNQSSENDLMKTYYKKWFGTEVTTSAAGKMNGSQMMSSQAGIDRLDAAADFDEAFLAEMTEHHQMGVMMANMLDARTNRPEMKKLAEDIITSQTKEINDMRLWQQQWGYELSDKDTGEMMNMMGR